MGWGFLLQEQQRLHTGGCQIYENPSSPSQKRNGKKFSSHTKKATPEVQPFSFLSADRAVFE
jgi:hypothetical protein